MARIIAITNNKGGCGKTTTAVNMAAALRLQGYDVLAVDLDGQANLTQCFRAEANDTMADALADTSTPFINPVRVLSPEGTAGVLDVLPSCRDLQAVEIDLTNKPDRFTRLSGVVDKYREKYDVIIIDTPPASGVLTISALFAADEYIVTVKPEYLDVQGLIAIERTIKQVEAAQGAPLAGRVLFTHYDRRKTIHNMTIEQVEALDTPTFNTRIRSNVALGEAPYFGTDIFRYNKRSNGAQDYAALVAEYLSGRKLKHSKHTYSTPQARKSNPNVS